MGVDGRSVSAMHVNAAASLRGISQLERRLGSAGNDIRRHTDGACTHGFTKSHIVHPVPTLISKTQEEADGCRHICQISHKSINSFPHHWTGLTRHILAYTAISRHPAVGVCPTLGLVAAAIGFCQHFPRQNGRFPCVRKCLFGHHRSIIVSTRTKPTPTKIHARSGKFEHQDSTVQAG